MDDNNKELETSLKAQACKWFEDLMYNPYTTFYFTGSMAIRSPVCHTFRLTNGLELKTTFEIQDLSLCSQCGRKSQENFDGLIS